MSKDLRNKEINARSFDEFKQGENNQIDEYYSRYLWTIKEWKKIIEKMINRPPHINRLYFDGSRAFYYGCYSASILTITATIELTLKAITDISKIPEKKRNFKNVIDEAHKQGIISDNLKDEVHYLRKNTRNILTHDQKMGSHMTLGWEKDPDNKTGHMLTNERLEKLSQLQRDSKESFFVSNEVFARETIQLLFRVFNSCIVSGNNWSNLI